jgi:DNA polymerase-1
MLVNTPEQFYESLNKFTRMMVVDIETDGLDVWQDNRLCGIGICTQNEETFYYPFRHDDANYPLLSMLEGPLNLPLTLLPILFDQLYQCDAIIGHNLKFDLTGMMQDGFVLPDSVKTIDTLVASRLRFHDSYDPLDLESVVEALFPNEPALRWKREFKDYLKKSKSDTYDKAHPKIMAEYCERDCLMTLRIWHKLYDYICETAQDTLWEQEAALLRVVWNMEREGLYFDRQYALDKAAQLKSRIIELGNEICSDLGQTINVGSTQQLTVAMNSLGIHSPKLTKAKKQSWDNDALMKLGHPVGAKILAYRSFIKMVGTYLEPPLKWNDDRMHPSFNQARPITGRFSCSNPNLQNLINGSFLIRNDSVDHEAAQALADSVLGGADASDEFAGLIAQAYTGTDNEVSVKRLFVPPPGYSLFLYDFDQMEMRVFADYINDEHTNHLLENEHFDFHKYVATEVWGAKPGTPLWKFYRKLAKAINFGLIFCVGDEKLGLKINKTTDEARQYKFDYFRMFPKAGAFIQEVIATVKKRGYVFNRFNRKYYIDADRAYVGVNYLIQGTSADIVKNRMIACSNYLKDLKSKMVVQVHDELVFYVHDDELSFVPKELKRIIEERQIKTFLPVKVERGNPSWIEKAPVCVDCLAFLTKAEDEGDEAHVCQAK